MAAGFSSLGWAVWAHGQAGWLLAGISATTREACGVASKATASWRTNEAHLAVMLRHPAAKLRLHQCRLEGEGERALLHNVLPLGLCSSQQRLAEPEPMECAVCMEQREGRGACFTCSAGRCSRGRTSSQGNAEHSCQCRSLCCRTTPGASEQCSSSVERTFRQPAMQIGPRRDSSCCGCLGPALVQCGLIPPSCGAGPSAS